MKLKTLEELKKLSVEDLNAELSSLTSHQAFFVANTKDKWTGEQNVKNISTGADNKVLLKQRTRTALRKNRARILTLINEKRLGETV